MIQKELKINEILKNVPKIIKEYIDYSIEDLKTEKGRNNAYCSFTNDLVYADNNICYYDCHDGSYLYIETLEVIGLGKEKDDESAYYENDTLYVNCLAENYIFVDDGEKEELQDIANKYSLPSINNNCFVADKFENVLKKYQNEKQYNNLNILKNTKDYEYLKSKLTKEDLINMEKVLEDFIYYQSLYDDGNIDIIGEYQSKYGNDYIIDWYEGLLDTDDFIKTLNCDIENEM